MTKTKTMRIIDLETDPNDQYETTEEHQMRYFTKRVFKDGSTPRIVEENLTLQQAIKQVRQDQTENPNADYYMMTITAMPN